ncbi:MAG: hypothetical protein Q4A37_02970 [Candidatus Saccharibacteria bacterium]|nr:hypothetical protein [Candidatus Saccharibacteria bacterium]
MSQSKNSLDILQPFFSRYGSDTEVQLIGGAGSAALQHDDVRMSSREGVVRAPKDLFLPTVRDNGSKRDVDVFIASVNPEKINEVEQFLEETVAGQLDVSVFGIHDSELLRQQTAKPLGVRACMAFTSDRYENPSGDGFVKALFPFMAPIDLESLRPWRLEIGDTSVHMPHPGMSLINYANRSISGVRQKDEAKLQIMSSTLKDKAPEAIAWCVDGPGRSQLELAKLIHAAGVGMEPLQRLLPAELSPLAVAPGRHEYCMLRETPKRVQQLALGMFATKAHVLRAAESSSLVTGIWQRFFERGVAAGIVENK